MILSVCLSRIVLCQAASNIEQVLAATPPQDTNYTATCLLSWKLSKLDEPDMQDTAGEAGTSS